MNYDEDQKVAGSYYQKFHYIAVRAFRRAIDCKEKIEEIQHKEHSLTDDDSFTIVKLNGEIEICGIEVVIFSTLALESFINYYALTNLSKEYMENYLSDLDVISKWVVTPKLVLGRGLDWELEPIKNLKILISTRDHLIQYKTRQNFSNKFKGVDRFWIEDMDFTIDTVINLVEALAEIDEKINPGWVKKPNPGG